MTRKREQDAMEVMGTWDAQEWIRAVLISLGLLAAACAIFGTTYWFVTTP